MEVKAAREFSEKRREKMAGAGVAMPDGSYPIPDKDALRRAIASFGRAKDPAATKSHIIKRARALGATDMLPADWKAAGKGSMAAGHAAMGAGILQSLYGLISCEADEPDQAQVLQQAATLISRWIEQERGEIGAPDDPDEADYGKARKHFVEMKAEPMETSALDRWLDGKIPRRILMLPFGGPLPGGKAGLDVDGEYFDDETDIYGPFPALRRSRERLVDWHHDAMYRKLGQVGDPTGVMKGAIIGRVIFDADPEGAEGYWADWWAQAGERRMALIKALEGRNVPLFGSTQAVSSAVRKADDGHIEMWPVVRHTITTSPQNTFAVVPPLKALLTADLPDDIGIAAIKAALVGLDGRSFSGGGRGFRQSGEYVLSERDRRLAREIGVAIREVALR